MADAPANAIPFFRFHRGAGAGEPLGLMSGLLLFDSGEAEQTFLYRCQDRYLTYNSLCGLRTVLFVAGEEHRGVYRDLIEDHDRRMRLIRERTGIPLPNTPPPWFATVDLRQLAPVTFPESHTLALNQVSPTCAQLAGEDLSPVGAAALAWHDKAHYVRAAERADGLPPHAATAVLSPEEFGGARTWQRLCAIWSEHTGRPTPEALYVKPSRDSGGNGAARMTQSHFEAVSHRLREWLRRGQELAELRTDIALTPSLASTPFSERQLRAFRREQQQRRRGVSVLVQEAIEAPEDAAIQGLGITCHIRSAYCVEVIAAAGQLYRDAGRHRFRGSYVDDRLLDELLARKVHQLCLLPAREGYRGPVNFDARRSATGEWVFVYDCNPRLSALYPALAVREWLRSAGWEVRSVASLGYRGEFAGTLLDDGLLLSDGRRSGILPLPNLARPNGLDLVAVNVPFADLGGLAARCGIESRIY